MTEEQEKQAEIARSMSIQEKLANIKKLYAQAEEHLSKMLPCEASAVHEDDDAHPVGYMRWRLSYELEKEWRIVVGLDKGAGNPTERLIDARYTPWAEADYSMLVAGARGLPLLIMAVRDRRKNLDDNAEKIIAEVQASFDALDMVR